MFVHQIYTKQNRQILHFYKNWSEGSRSKNFASILNLIQPGSKFYELTTNLQKSIQSGTPYYYNISSLEIVNISRNQKSATVKGIIQLLFFAEREPYKGQFISACIKEDIWKLDDIEIEWD